MEIRKPIIIIAGAAALTLGLACVAAPEPTPSVRLIETPRPTETFGPTSAPTLTPTPTLAPTATPSLTAPTPTTERDEILATIRANMPTARPPTPWPTPIYPTPTAAECEEYRQSVESDRRAGMSDRQIYEDVLSVRIADRHMYAVLFHAGLCGVRLDAVPRPQHTGLEIFN